VTAAETLRIAAVLDATGSSAERRAGALGGFLADGLALPDCVEAEAVTYVFSCDDACDGPAVLQAPTVDVRLTPVPPHRPDLIAAALTTLQVGGSADLYVFPSGPSGTELAARLAARAGGSVLTGVLSADVSGGQQTCRRIVCAGHLTGAFELGPRPWCLVLDAGWADARFEPPKEHVIGSAELPVADASADGISSDAVPAPPPLLEIEELEAPATRDLESASFLVVAGRGAERRGGVERIAAAAARMGAAFGVTRPVAMNAWAGPDRQIGVSGTRTAPAVCIVAGASGAPAFMWGIERAGFIAAVDIDNHAPIAAECDAFVAGDAVAVLEALADLVTPAEDEM
jgi:electron transfer flavoprotein alpha subunit